MFPLLALRENNCNEKEALTENIFVRKDYLGCKFFFHLTYE